MIIITVINTERNFGETEENNEDLRSSIESDNN
jgi:hypothetical protein